jgi:hypothetical protein
MEIITMAIGGDARVAATRGPLDSFPRLMIRVSLEHFTPFNISNADYL